MGLRSFWPPTQSQPATHDCATVSYGRPYVSVLLPTRYRYLSYEQPDPTLPAHLPRSPCRNIFYVESTATSTVPPLDPRLATVSYAGSYSRPKLLPCCPYPVLRHTVPSPAIATQVYVSQVLPSVCCTRYLPTRNLRSPHICTKRIPMAHGHSPAIAT